jgi:DNA-binding transcriptional ArsR family regulator
MADVKEKLLAAKLAVLEPRLRILMGKEKTLIEEGNVYGEKITKEEFDKKIEEILSTEIIRKMIYAMIWEEPLSVEKLSEKTGLSPDIIFKNILALQRKGLAQIEKIEDNWPLYKGVKQE